MVWAACGYVELRKRVFAREDIIPLNTHVDLKCVHFLPIICYKCIYVLLLVCACPLRVKFGFKRILIHMW